MGTTHIRLDGYCAQNWDCDAAPVAILNTETTLHERLAYCWGLGSQIEELARLLNTSTDTTKSRIGTLLTHNIDPLMAMLNDLANSTAKEVDHG
jgi:hypothetical protein